MRKIPRIFAYPSSKVNGTYQCRQLWFPARPSSVTAHSTHLLCLPSTHQLSSICGINCSVFWLLCVYSSELFLMLYTYLQLTSVFRVSRVIVLPVPCLPAISLLPCSKPHGVFHLPRNSELGAGNDITPELIAFQLTR